MVTSAQQFIDWKLEVFCNIKEQKDPSLSSRSGMILYLIYRILQLTAVKRICTWSHFSISTKQELAFESLLDQAGV